MISSIVNTIVRPFGYEFKIKFNKRKGDQKEPVRNEKSNRLTLHNTATGNYFLPTDAKRDVVANTIISGAIFEKEVVEIAKMCIIPGTVVLDVGSNYGQMGILFSNFTGENGHVHCFEADNWVFEILQKNIQANNKTGNITAHYGAVHNKDNETLIFEDHNLEEWGSYGSYGIDYNAQKGKEVKSLTIDSLNIQETVSFMKIDIQGGDLQAMQGAVNLIQKNKMPILFEYEYHFEDKYNLSFQDYIDFVSSIGYKFSKVINGHNYLIIPR